MPAGEAEPHGLRRSLASEVRRRGVLLALFAVVFAVLFALSWQKWPDLAIDGGREMNTPLRLLRGELIYSDVYYLYGPLAPYLNAALYAVFGMHLNTLYGAGTVASLLVLLLVFNLGKTLTGFQAAVPTTWTVLVFCVFKRNGNYVFPYTYSAVYGTLLGLGALAAQIRYVDGRRSRALTLAGVLAGLAFICKLEFGFAATAGLVAVAFSERPGARLHTLIRGLWPALAIPVVVYSVLLWVVPWDRLVRDTFLWPADIPAELIHFNRTKLGLGDPAKTLREMLSALCMLGIAASAVLAAGARSGAGSVRAVLRALPQPWSRRLLLVAGGSVAALLVNVWVYKTRWDVSPFRALPVLCLGVIWDRARRSDGTQEDEVRRRSLLVLGVYSFAVLARVVLRVPSGGAYGSYLLPVPASPVHASGNDILPPGICQVPSLGFPRRPECRHRAHDGSDCSHRRDRVPLRQGRLCRPRNRQGHHEAVPIGQTRFQRRPRIHRANHATGRSCLGRSRGQQPEFPRRPPGAAALRDSDTGIPGCRWRAARHRATERETRQVGLPAQPAHNGIRMPRVRAGLLSRPDAMD